jgi:hypothetical protein
MAWANDPRGKNPRQKTNAPHSTKYGEVPLAFVVPSRRNSTDLQATLSSAPSDASEDDSEPSRSNSLVQSVHDVVGANLGPLSRLAGGVHLVPDLPRLGVSFGFWFLCFCFSALALDVDVCADDDEFALQTGKFDKMQLKERAKALATNGVQAAAA